MRSFTTLSIRPSPLVWSLFHGDHDPGRLDLLTITTLIDAVSDIAILIKSFSAYHDPPRVILRAVLLPYHKNPIPCLFDIELPCIETLLVP